jgi:DNA-binding beta-propeller fold protein YncE
MSGALTLLAAGLLAASPAHTGHPGRGGAPPRVYVANQAAAKVTVIDPIGDSIVTTVDLQALGFSAHAKPHYVAVEPDGSYWYVSLVGDNAVVKLDRDNHVVGKAPMETPGLLALDPKSDRLFATRSMSAVRAPSRIGVIKRSDMSIEEVDVLVPRPHALALSRDGHYAYVGSLGTNQIAVYDVARDRVDVVDVPGDSNRVMVQFAVSPSGRTMAVSAQLTGEVLALDLKDPAHPALAHSVRVGKWPWHIAFSEKGDEVWVPNQLSNDVSVIHVADWKVSRTLNDAGFAQPHGIAVTANGQVFISNHNTGKSMDMGGVGMAAGDTSRPGHVVVIDANHHRVLRTLDTAPDGAGMGSGGMR